LQSGGNSTSFPSAALQHGESFDIQDDFEDARFNRELTSGDTDDWQMLSGGNVTRSHRTSVTSAGSLDTTMSDSLQTLSTSETSSVRSSVLSPCDDCKSFVYEKDGQNTTESRDIITAPSNCNNTASKRGSAEQRRPQSAVSTVNRHHDKDYHQPITHHPAINKCVSDDMTRRISTGVNECAVQQVSTVKSVDSGKTEKPLMRRKSSGAIRTPPLNSSTPRILPSRPPVTSSKDQTVTSSSALSLKSSDIGIHSEINRATLNCGVVSRRSSLTQRKPINPDVLYSTSHERATSPLTLSNSKKKTIVTARKNITKDFVIETAIVRIKTPSVRVGTPVATIESKDASNLFDRPTPKIDQNEDCSNLNCTSVHAIARHSNSFSGSDAKMIPRREDRLAKIRTRIPRPVSALERHTTAVTCDKLTIVPIPGNIATVLSASPSLSPTVGKCRNNS